MTSAPTSKIEQYLDTKRQSLVRLSPRESYAESQQNKDTVVLIDIRPSSFRQAEGAIPGALIIERNVLEWRLDPSSPDKIPEASREGFSPIIFCNEGYASSLAAHVLQELGISKATDMMGGFRSWKEEGLPVVLS